MSGQLVDYKLVNCLTNKLLVKQLIAPSSIYIPMITITLESCFFDSGCKCKSECVCTPECQWCALMHLNMNANGLEIHVSHAFGLMAGTGHAYFYLLVRKDRLNIRFDKFLIS